MNIKPYDEIHENCGDHVILRFVYKMFSNLHRSPMELHKCGSLTIRTGEGILSRLLFSLLFAIQNL